MSLKRALAVVAAGALAGAGGIASVALSAGPAAAAGTTQFVQLPFTSSYSGTLLVDPANQHLFVTGGAGSSSIVVVDYSGNTVATIPNEPGATGLALSGDGSTVYVALAGGDAISAISTSTLTETARYATGTGTDPAYVADAGGKVWFGYTSSFSSGPAGIGSLDPGTSPATVTLNATNDPPGNWNSAPELAATPAGDLVAADGVGPLELASYDVSTGTASTLTPPTSFGNYSGLTDMQITSDGQDVVVGTSPAQTIFQVSDLSAVGTFTLAPNATRVAFASDGTVATGTSGFVSGRPTGEISLFAPGGSTPLNTYSLGAFPPLGLAFSPDVSELFSVQFAGVTLRPKPVSHYGLTIITDPAQTPSTLTLAGPDAAVKHDTPVTLTGTLGGTAPYTGGQTLTVTRTDSAEPDGVALPDVTTAADGSFTLTDTPPKMHANQGVVTYEFSYAGDPLLTASTATFSVTVQPGNGNDNNS